MNNVKDNDGTLRGKLPNRRKKFFFKLLYNVNYN
jgi:hypothetical protein